MGCSPPPAPRAPSPPEHAAEPPRVASFAELAPARTRLLARFELGGLELWFPVPPLDRIGAAATKCGFDLESDRVTIDLAIAEPAELRADLHGAITVEKLACMLEAPVGKDGAASQGPFRLQSLPSGGVRVATRGAVADGPGAPIALQSRFSAASKRSDFTLAATLGPRDAPIDLLITGGPTPELQLGLADRGQAEEARDLLMRSISLVQKSADRSLDVVDLRAEDRTLIIGVRQAFVGAALSLRHNVLEAFKIPSGSMLPGLIVGDHVLISKGEPGRTVTRGDVVVFRSPQNQAQKFVKRVIGVGGDHVEIQGYTLRLNGSDVAPAEPTLALPRPAPDAKLSSETIGGRTYSILHDLEGSPRDEIIDVHVPPGSIFVLGDNRDNSFDSRQFGVVPVSSIEGRVMVIWASLDEAWTPRWDRLGRVVR